MLTDLMRRLLGNAIYPQSFSRLEHRELMDQVDVVRVPTTSYAFRIFA